MIISNTIAIAQRELRGYFASPLAYIIAAIFWFISGLLFYELAIGDRGIIQQVALSERMGVDIGSIDVATELLNSFLAVLSTLSLFLIPILSMGLYAEEKKRGTLELLATSPITNWVVALGKLLAAVLLFVFMILPAMFYEAIAFSAAEPPISLSIPLIAHFGLILLVASLLSVGMFISSLTNSTIIAAILTFAVVILVWIIEAVSSNLSGQLREILLALSLLEGFNNLVSGIIKVSDLVLFFSCIFLGIYLTAQSIHTLRLNRP